MSFTLTHKDLLELKYWFTADIKAERAMLRRYLDVFQVIVPRDGAALEIGTGPHWGLLPYLDAWRKVGVDPLYPAFYAAGILAERDGIIQVDERFEQWDTNETFHVILSTNALDHGEMGFYTLLKLSRLLKPGGRLYLHVHMRRPEMLNLLHDHQLTEADLDKHLHYTDLVEERREIFPRDVDGNFEPTLVGTWRKPL